MLEACPSVAFGIALQALQVREAPFEQFEHFWTSRFEAEAILIDVDFDFERQEQESYVRRASRVF